MRMFSGFFLSPKLCNIPILHIAEEFDILMVQSLEAH